MNVPGSKGYQEAAEDLVRRYERILPADKYRPILHLLPDAPCSVLDVGAGSGVDAAWLASLGHEVFAVEPTDELRRRGMALHATSPIRWLDDSLPLLDSVAALKRRFELITVAGVWTHLDEQEQRASLCTLASMLASGGIVVISIRRGAAVEGRLAFAVSIPHMVRQAQAVGLRLELLEEARSLQAGNRAAGVTWAWLAFRRDGVQ